MFFNLATLVTFLRNIDDVIHYSNQYTTCSAGGDNNYCEQFREKAAERSIAPSILSVISIVFISLMNFSHLLYLVSFLAIKKFLQKCYK